MVEGTLTIERHATVEGDIWNSGFLTVQVTVLGSIRSGDYGALKPGSASVEQFAVIKG